MEIAGQQASMDYAHAYAQLHRNEKWFPGSVIERYVDDIVLLVEQCQAKRILDYGSGKGYQYLKLRLHERWGGVLPYCYDVGVRQLAERPEGLFTGVICTDVMEHIAEPDVPLVLKDLLSFIDFSGPPCFLFLSISCRTSDRKELPDGRNVHLTVKPPEWWDKQIEKVVGPVFRDGMLLKVRYELAE